MTEKMLNRIWEAIFGTSESTGILVRLARIELQLYGIYFMLTATIGMLAKLIWFTV